MKDEEKRRIGDYTGARNTWGNISPVTKVKPSKRTYKRSEKHKGKRYSDE